MSSGKPNGSRRSCGRIPDHAPARESLEALREATPKPIAFDDLDFNLGERWIPKGVYERFASSLFDTEVKITFASNLDEYGVKAEATNVKITEQYAVSAQTRKYNGLHLFETRPAKHFARHHQDRPQMGGRRTAGGQSA